VGPDHRRICRLPQDGRAICAAHGLILLLDGMRQFMGQEGAARLGARRVSILSESNMRTGGVCVGLNGARRRCRFRAVVHPHMAQIAAETRLEEVARGAVERPAGGAQDARDPVRQPRGTPRRGCLAMNARLLLLALGAWRAAAAARTGAGNRNSAMGAHDLPRHLVGLALLRIVRLADRQLRADQPAAQQLLHGVVSSLLLQRKKRMGRRRCG